ncbi:MAG: hypothetical protein QOC75_906 [Pseudonocardiales bacterium]|nr:hypothetical protein [Pseudonocardiales bacterium]
MASRPADRSAYAARHTHHRHCCQWQDRTRASDSTAGWERGSACCTSRQRNEYAGATSWSPRQHNRWTRSRGRPASVAVPLHEPGAETGEFGPHRRRFEHLDDGAPAGELLGDHQWRRRGQPGPDPAVRSPFGLVTFGGEWRQTHPAPLHRKGPRCRAAATTCGQVGDDIAQLAWTSHISHRARRPREMRDVVLQGARQARKVRGRPGTCAACTERARRRPARSRDGGSRSSWHCRAGDPARTSVGSRRSRAPPAEQARGQPAAADALVDLVALPRLAATGLAAAGVTSLDRNWPV